MVKKLARAIMPRPTTMFDVDEILDSGRLLHSASSAMARTYNPRPEQKLAHHTEDTEQEDQLPSDRTQRIDSRLIVRQNRNER
jgi:hypothetical protein